jgi:hypothetical protein
MKQRKKILAVGLLAIFSVALFGAEALAATTAKKSVWSDYFSWDESKMIKKLAKDHIYSLLKKDSGWKKLIASKAKVKDGSISEDKIEDGAVSTEKLADHAVTADKIANNAVAADEIRDGTVISEDIEDNGIATVDLEDGAVTVAKMSSNSCTNGQVLKFDGTAWACGSDNENAEATFGVSIDSSEITDGTIVNADISGSAAITGTKISPDFGSQNITTSGNLNLSQGRGILMGGDNIISTGGAGDIIIGDQGYSTLFNGSIYSGSDVDVPNILFTNNIRNKDSGGDLNIYTVDSGDITLNPASGNVGIGTTSPGSLLHLSGSSAEMRLSGSATNQLIRHSFYDNNETLKGFIQYSGSNSAGAKSFDVASNSDYLTLYSANDEHTSYIKMMTNGWERIRVADDGNIGIGTTSPSGILDVASTTEGVVIPRMTKVQRNAISSPVAGTMVYQTDNTPGLRVYNGTNWMRFTETAD